MSNQKENVLFGDYAVIIVFLLFFFFPFFFFRNDPGIGSRKATEKRFTN